MEIPRHIIDHEEIKLTDGTVIHRLTDHDELLFDIYITDEELKKMADPNDMNEAYRIFAYGLASVGMELSTSNLEKFRDYRNDYARDIIGFGVSGSLITPFYEQIFRQKTWESHEKPMPGFESLSYQYVSGHDVVDGEICQGIVVGVVPETEDSIVIIADSHDRFSFCLSRDLIMKDQQGVGLPDELKAIVDKFRKS